MVQLVVSLLLTILGLFAIARGLPLINAGRKARKWSKRIDGTETRAAGDLRPTPVVVEGTATTTDEGKTVEAPVSGGIALVTTFGVEAYEDGWTTRSEGWTERFERNDAARFLVEDDTGAVLVEAPSDGEFDLDTEHEYVGSDERPPERIRRFVEKRVDGAAADLLDEGEPRRYLEGRVVPGDDIVVVGEAREVETAWSDYAYVIDGGSDPAAFVLSDSPEEELVGEGRQAGLLLCLLGGLITGVGAILVAGAWLA